MERIAGADTVVVYAPVSVVEVGGGTADGTRATGSLLCSIYKKLVSRRVRVHNAHESTPPTRSEAEASDEYVSATASAHSESPPPPLPNQSPTSRSHSKSSPSSSSSLSLSVYDRLLGGRLGALKDSTLESLGGGGSGGGSGGKDDNEDDSTTVIDMERGERKKPGKTLATVLSDCLAGEDCQKMFKVLQRLFILVILSFTTSFVATIINKNEQSRN